MAKRKLDILKGKLKVGREFFEPLSPKDLVMWEGGTKRVPDRIARPKAARVGVKRGSRN